MADDLDLRPRKKRKRVDLHKTYFSYLNIRHIRTPEKYELTKGGRINEGSLYRHRSTILYIDITRKCDRIYENRAYGKLSNFTVWHKNDNLLLLLANLDYIIVGSTHV